VRMMHLHWTCCGSLDDVNDDAESSRESIATIQRYPNYTALRLVYVRVSDDGKFYDLQTSTSNRSIKIRHIHPSTLISSKKEDRAVLPHLAARSADHSFYFHPLLATLALIWSTTAGSASVLRSPSWSPSPATILRMMRRIILPDRVLGRSLTM